LVGAGRVAEVPWTTGVGPVTGDDTLEALLATTWRPQLTVVGQDGLPAGAIAGNAHGPNEFLHLPTGRKVTAAVAAVLHAAAQPH
jgi:hypothetical protein